MPPTNPTYRPTCKPFAPPAPSVRDLSCCAPGRYNIQSDSNHSEPSQLVEFGTNCRLMSVVQQSTSRQLCFIMNIKQKYGIEVKKFRINKGWSQEKLALNADLDRTYIPGIEKGERNVSIVVIEKIAIALDVDIKDFFERSSEIK